MKINGPIHCPICAQERGVAIPKHCLHIEELIMTELESLCIANKITINSMLDGAEPTNDWQKDCFSWRVVLYRERKKLAVDYFTGKAHVTSYSQQAKLPKVADVLHCLCSDATSGDMSFKDFCSEFGYSDDSRKASEIYTACTTTAIKLKAFLGNKFETFCQAEH
jgi:hypothetical protein